MPSERVQNAIDSYLDEIEIAAKKEHWDTILNLVANIRELDKSNSDVLPFEKLANARLGVSRRAPTWLIFFTALVLFVVGLLLDVAFGWFFLWGVLPVMALFLVPFLSNYFNISVPVKRKDKDRFVNERIDANRSISTHQQVRVESGGSGVEIFLRIIGAILGAVVGATLMQLVFGVDVSGGGALAMRLFGGASGMAAGRWLFGKFIS